MKNISNQFLSFIATVIIAFNFSSCTEPQDFPYYQMRNETGKDMLLKVSYYIPPDSIRVGSHLDYFPDSIILKNNESSEEFYSISGYHSESNFLFYVDSLFVFLDGDLKKTYTRPDNFVIKTPLLSVFFDRKNKGSKGQTVNVYTFLPEDFE